MQEGSRTLIEEIASDEQVETRKTEVAILHRLNIFEDQEEIMVRSLGLQALIVAAAVLNVERMELELPGQLVELRVIGIIKGVPGHEEPSCDEKNMVTQRCG